ncbi:hypothetical protein U1Q18_008870 [Sarracenia purpurea var. burkii]
MPAPIPIAPATDAPVTVPENSDQSGQCVPSVVGLASAEVLGVQWWCCVELGVLAVVLVWCGAECVHCLVMELLGVTVLVTALCTLPFGIAELVVLLCHMELLLWNAFQA